MTQPELSWRYRGVHVSGLRETGVVEAATREAARARLAERGLFPLEIRLAPDGGTRRARLRPDDLALGLRMLATLLDSDLPLSRALAAFEEVAPPAWSRALPSIRAAVREGKSLAAALSEAPLHVPPLVVGMVQAGEAGSGVAAAVARAASITERAAGTRRAIRAALAYPAVLAAAGTASLALLVGFVLPRFTAILADLGESLPPATRLLLDVAALGRAGAIPGAAVLLGVAVALRAWVATDSGRARLHETFLDLPAVGPIRRSAAVARFAGALAALLESGVPAAAALAHASRATGDAAIAARVLVAREEVVAGSRMSSALGAAEALTPTAHRLVRAGEESGRLAAMLTHAATIEEQRAREAVAALVRVIEPSLILVFGAAVAFVAAALLQAVYAVAPR